MQKNDAEMSQKCKLCRKIKLKRHAMKIEQRLKSHKNKLGGWRESRKPSPLPRLSFYPVLWSHSWRNQRTDLTFIVFSQFICFHLSTVCPANDRVIQPFRHATKGQTKEEKSSESLQSVRKEGEIWIDYV